MIIMRKLFYYDYYEENMQCKKHRKCIGRKTNNNTNFKLSNKYSETVDKMQPKMGLCSYCCDKDRHLIIAPTK